MNLRNLQQLKSVGIKNAEGQFSLAPKVLVLAKEKCIYHACRQAAEAAGFEVVVLKSAAAAYKVLWSGEFGVVLLYLRWPDDQLDVLQNIKRRHPQIAVIVMTGYGTVQSAVQSMKFGAYDYLITPLKSEELMLAIVAAAQCNRSAEEQNAQLPNPEALQRSRVEAERTVIFSALRAVEGNKDRAARLLGIGRTTLYQKLKHMETTDPEEELVHAQGPDHDD